MQVKMLLEGKEIKSPKIRYKLPPGDSEAREVLQKFENKPEMFQFFAIFLDLDQGQLVVEEQK